MRKKFILSLMLLTFTFLFGDDHGRSRRHSRMSTDLSPTDKVLFILHAKDAHLEKNPPKKGAYILTLYNVSDDVTYFTDRPARKAGKMSMNRFLKTVGDGRPNAGLVSSQASQKRSSANFSDVPITLSNLQYDNANNRMTLDVEIIGKSPSIETGDLGSTTLFIDDFNPYPGG